MCVCVCVCWLSEIMMKNTVKSWDVFKYNNGMMDRKREAGMDVDKIIEMGGWNERGWKGGQTAGWMDE